MEKMDYQDDEDNNDGYCDNTAKKRRMSSYESSSASLQSVQSSSNTFNPSSSQIYTGNYGNVSIVFQYHKKATQIQFLISLNVFNRYNSFIYQSLGKTIGHISVK